jgi:hypothetical protein
MNNLQSFDKKKIIVKNINNIDYNITLKIKDKLLSVNLKYNKDILNFVNYQKKCNLIDWQINNNFFMKYENIYEVFDSIEQLFDNGLTKIVNKENDNSIDIYLNSDKSENEIIINLPLIQNNVNEEIKNLKDIIKDIYNNKIKNLEEQNKILIQENKKLNDDILYLKNIIKGDVNKTNNNNSNEYRVYDINSNIDNNELENNKTNNEIFENINEIKIENKNNKDLKKENINLEFLYKIKIHDNWISNIIILNDGRIVSCSFDKKIIIYNLETFNKDITINVLEAVYYLMNLKNYNNNFIAATNTHIYSISINKNSYVINKKIEINQILFKTIEISNNIIIGGGKNKELFFFKNENDFVIDKIIKKEGQILDLIEIKKDVIFIYMLKKNILEFYDYNNNQIISSFEFQDCQNWHIGKKIYKLNDKHIFVIGQNQIIIIDIVKYEIINSIYDNTIFTIGTYNNRILISSGKGDLKECIIKNNQISLKNIKSNAHNTYINCIIENNNNVLITGDNNGLLKIWSIS